MKSLLTLFTLLFSATVFAQNDKVIFIKDVPVKLKSEYSYSFFVGYEVLKDSDIAMDFSGGPSKFWAGNTVPVAKGKGIFEFKLNTQNKPTPGKGYKISIAIRERGGDWSTTKASSLINNIEVVKKPSPILDNASFSGTIQTSVSSKSLYEFDIKYIASQPRMIVVAIYNQGKWVAASKSITVEKGSGIKKIEVKTNPLPEGNKYRFILYYGSGKGFPDTHIVSKEISGIQIKKPEKTITLSDLRKKSIGLSLNKGSNILTLPGDSKYEFIQIIAMNGKVVKESKNTDTIKVLDLPKGGYFAITNKDEYYKFIKF